MYRALYRKWRPQRFEDVVAQHGTVTALRNQVALIRPKIIVCVGRIADMTLIQPDYKVTRQHGEWIQKNGVWMMGTFHPAALLRNPYNTKNGFADFLSLREKIRELEIEI